MHPDAIATAAAKTAHPIHWIVVFIGFFPPSGQRFPTIFAGVSSTFSLVFGFQNARNRALCIRSAPELRFPEGTEKGLFVGMFGLFHGCSVLRFCQPMFPMASKKSVL
ncbi:MAG: hypothetical protein J6Y19_08000 [Kiritimatiellae bacterium]|nr:hypothetical protein [Kiritimatiellia bacterium]